MTAITIDERIKMLTDLGLRPNENGDGFEYKDIEVSSAVMCANNDEEYTAYVNEIKTYMLANPSEYPLPGAQSQQLTIIDKAKETLLSGGAILQRNQSKSQLFVKAAKRLIDSIIANGGVLNADLDIKANDAVLKLKQASKEIDEDTKPIRQAMVFIRDELTACGKAVDSEAETIQKYRNEWAAECERQRKINEENERKAAEKRQEIINVKADIEKSLLKYFNDHLFAKKQFLNTWFNEITLENFEAKEKSLNESNPVYKSEHYVLFKYSYAGRILTNDEIINLVSEIATQAKFDEFFAQFQAEMLELKAEKVDLLPSKKSELERIAEFEREQEESRKRLAAIEEEKKTADAARQKELKKLQEQAEARQAEARQKELEEKQAQADREKEEQERQEEESRKALAAQNTKVDVEAAQATSINLFEQTANTTPLSTGTKTKKVLKATISAPVGIYPLFQLWMEDKGMKMTTGQLSDKLDFLFTYASKRANDKQPLQIENEFVVYVEDVKAVTTKDKKEKEAVV